MRFSSSAGCSLAVLSLTFGQAFAAQSRRLEGDALAAAESRARAAVAPLADGSPAIDTRQAFDVAEGGAHTLVVPVRYSPRVPGPLANVDACALAISTGDRPVEAVRTIGSGYTETVGCTGLDGIAFPDLDGDGRFEIALIYSTLAPPDRERKTPVVLRRGKEGAFAVDESLGEALDRKGGITTLGALRRAAAARLKKH
jgi:hypothetical protein